MKELFDYRILVFEDDQSVKDTLIMYAIKDIKKEMNLNLDIVFFDEIHNIENSSFEDAISGGFDVVLCDYNFADSRILKKQINGLEVLQKIRKKNKNIKIIFYSTAFEYDDRIGRIQLVSKSINVDSIIMLINEVSVFRVIPNKTKYVVSAVVDALKNVDPFFSVLQKIEKKYNESVEMEANGTMISLEDLITDYLNDGESSRAVQREFYDILIHTMIKLKKKKQSVL